MNIQMGVKKEEWDCPPKLLVNHAVTMDDFCRWRKLILRMPYYYKCKIGGRSCVVVHGGYSEKLENIMPAYSNLEEFYLYARGESLRLGGKGHGIVIAGHTPTVIEKEFCFNQGNVFRYYDKEKDCVFYNIDCGSAMKAEYPDAKLACIRVEDEKIFYV